MRSSELGLTLRAWSRSAGGLVKVLEIELHRGTQRKSLHQVRIDSSAWLRAARISSPPSMRLFSAIPIRPLHFEDLSSGILEELSRIAVLIFLRIELACADLCLEDERSALIASR